MTKPRTPSPEADGPDGGWGWVLVGALFVCSALVFGVMRSLGIFFVEFVQYFEESAQSISWITSIAVATQQFFSPLAAALCSVYNTRVVVMTGGCLAGLGFILASQATCVVHLYLTMGVISGLGWGMLFTPLVATVMAHFTRRRSLAVGLGFSSIGLSCFIFNPMFQLLVETYAWRGALLILGGFSLNLVLCGAVIRPSRQSKAPAKVDSESRPLCAAMLWRVYSYLELSVLRERPFVTYTVAVTLFNAGYFVPYIHLVAYSRERGFSEYQAAFIMSAIGASDLLGRVASGWFSDLGHLRLVHMLTMWTSLAGVFIMLLPLGFMTGSYPALMVITIAYGFCAAALGSLVFSMVPKIVGLERMMGALGLLQLLESAGGLLGPPLSGFLKDITGSYCVSFIVAGGFLILGSIVMSTLPHFFSRSDPPPSQRHSPDNHILSGPTTNPPAVMDKVKTLHSEPSCNATASNPNC